MPNPNGPGVVLAKDPERTGWVRKMALRALRGDGVHDIRRWLDSAGAPRPRYARTQDSRWCYSTVIAILRNPLLVGMIPRQARGRHRAHARQAA